MATFLTAEVAVTPAGTTGWQDADLSAYLPAGATGAMIHVRHTDASTARGVGTRKNGSSDNRITSLYQGAPHYWVAIGVDASRIVELYKINAAVKYYLIGYFGVDAAFFTNATSKAITADSAWHDINIASDTGADTAIGAFFELIYASGGNSDFGLRNNGSTDTRHGNFNTHTALSVGVDGSEICEGYSSNITSLFLLGYMTSLAVFDVNGTDWTPASAGSYIDLTAFAATKIGGLIQTYGAGYNAAVRKNGDTIDIYGGPGGLGCAVAIVGGDANRVAEGKISSTSQKLFKIAAFNSPSTTWTYAGEAPLALTPEGGLAVLWMPATEIAISMTPEAAYSAVINFVYTYAGEIPLALLPESLLKAIRSYSGEIPLSLAPEGGWKGIYLPPTTGPTISMTPEAALRFAMTYPGEIPLTMALETGLKILWMPPAGLRIEMLPGHELGIIRAYPGEIPMVFTPQSLQARAWGAPGELSLVLLPEGAWARAAAYVGEIPLELIPEAVYHRWMAEKFLHILGATRDISPRGRLVIVPTAGILLDVSPRGTLAEKRVTGRLQVVPPPNTKFN